MLDRLVSSITQIRRRPRNSLINTIVAMAGVVALTLAATEANQKLMVIKDNNGHETAHFSSSGTLTMSGDLILKGGTLQLADLDCTGFSNGGALTTDGDGNIVCSSDDGGGGGGGTLSGTGAATQLTYFTGPQAVSGADIYWTDATKVLENPGTFSGYNVVANDTIRGAGLSDCDTAGTSKLLWDASTGRFSCGTDTDTNTTYTAGQGLTLTATSFRVNTTLTGSLANFQTVSGALVKAKATLASSGTLAVEGAVAFETELTVPNGGTGFETCTDGGFVTGNGTGILTCNAILTDNQIYIGDGTQEPTATAIPECTAGQKIQYTDAGNTLTCVADVDTNTTYTAGQGLTLNGTSFRTNATLTGSLSNFLTQSGSRVHANTLLTASGTLAVDGSVYFNGLNCSGNTNGGTLTVGAGGQVVCSDDDGGSGGSGISQSAADARYVNTAGDTMTGALAIITHPNEAMDLMKTVTAYGGGYTGTGTQIEKLWSFSGPYGSGAITSIVDDQNALALLDVYSSGSYINLYVSPGETAINGSEIESGNYFYVSPEAIEGSDASGGWQMGAEYLELTDAGGTQWLNLIPNGDSYIVPNGDFGIGTPTPTALAHITNGSYTIKLGDGVGQQLASFTDGGYDVILGDLAGSRLFHADDGGYSITLGDLGTSQFARLTDGGYDVVIGDLGEGEFFHATDGGYDIVIGDVNDTHLASFTDGGQIIRIGETGTGNMLYMTDGSMKYIANGTGLGINKPTVKAELDVAGSISGSKLTIPGAQTNYIVGNTSIGFTGTPDTKLEVLGTISGASLSIDGSAVIEKMLTGTATLDFASTASNNCSTLTITVTGAADGDVVVLGVPNASNIARGNFFGWVSAANTVSVKFCVYGVTGDPASGSFRATVFKF